MKKHKKKSKNKALLVHEVKHEIHYFPPAPDYEHFPANKEPHEIEEKPKRHRFLSRR